MVNIIMRQPCHARCFFMTTSVKHNTYYCEAEQQQL